MENKKINYLLKITDVDVFPGKIFDNSIRYLPRKAVRAIVLDDEGKIAVVGHPGKWKLLPGGGVEDGETLEFAIIRECKEETGCDVRIVGEVGETLEHREQSGRKQETRCFVVRVVGKKDTPTSMEYDEQGLETDWLTVTEAIKLLKVEKNSVILGYAASFNVRTHLAFLNEFLNFK